jgi:hypothetical protein
MTTSRVSSQKGRKPAHQNTFAFYHNKKSKRTQYIQAIPVEGVCGRCHQKIEWRKKFRKYKPLTVPRKWCHSSFSAVCGFSHCRNSQVCEQKNVKHAYHFLCAGCSASRAECPMCRKDFASAEYVSPSVYVGSRRLTFPIEPPLRRMPRTRSCWKPHSHNCESVSVARWLAF